MEIHENTTKLTDLTERLRKLADRCGEAQIKQRIGELEEEQTHPDFWKDNEAAQEKARKLSGLKEEEMLFTTARADLADCQALLELAEEEGGKKVSAEIAAELERIEKTIEAKERELQFQGPFDKHDAIITIQAGAGGTDAQDWAEMLERMYLRFAEARGWGTHSLERQTGEEAGLKHATFEIRGKFAYGLLKNEHGVHRLVRLSPFNADHLRQTSFARVEVLPKLPEKETPEIDEKDLEIDTFRSGGAGGQHVNKTSSAVRVRHIPTGVTVKVEQERSQGQNKAMALSMLASKLQLLAEAQHAANIKDLKGEVKEAAWGNQIRSYVLHPYKLVKDHRTKKEDTNAEGVLEGKLDTFIEVV